MAYDPAKLEIFRHLYASIAEEMGAALCRSSYSPNIKERRDFSCALFDAEGQMVAQAAHIPVHLGSMPLSVLAAIEGFDFQPADMVILNDPYAGGTHLPDITLVAPVFDDQSRLRFFVANRAHHADVGGAAPGSLGLTRSIHDEGVRIPPTMLLRRGRMDGKVLRGILAEVRTPEEREGDLAAQVAANELGVRRTRELLARRGEEALAYAEAVLDYAEELTRATIRRIPDGRYQFEDYLDDDGIRDRPVKIAATITVEGSTAHVDFAGTDGQVAGCVNAVFAVTLSAVYYVFRTLAGAEVPSNAGGMRPLTVSAPEGSVVNARFPAAVAGGNVETSQRIVDVLYGALAQALPEVVPAAS
ncbi:MAG: hydantoinase B/oxoprolinase family protein, partial [Armatimonadota bacterium]